MITNAIFRAATGAYPVQDDMQRCNCPEEGQMGHLQCGWCPPCNKPRFVCGHAHALKKE